MARNSIQNSGRSTSASGAGIGNFMQELMLSLIHI